MTYRIVNESGEFRKGNEGVFSGDKCIFVAPPPDMINGLMKEVMNWWIFMEMCTLSIWSLMILLYLNVSFHDTLECS